MKIFFIILLLPFYSFANTYYVSQNGNNDSSGLFVNKAWRTFSKVQSTVASGDSVLFERGSRFADSLAISNKSNIYFGAYGTGANPLFWGKGGTINELVLLSNCSNITFYGWTISDTTISPTDRTIQARIQIVFQFQSNSTNNVIRKCTMDRIGYGAYFRPFSNSNTMDSCDIGNLRMIRNTPQIDNDDDDFGGVPVQLSSRNNVVSNNYFHDCYAESFDYGNDGGGIEFFVETDTVKGNRVMYNTFYDGNGTFEFGSNSGALRPFTDNMIYYNKIINSSSLLYINNNPNANYETKVRGLQIFNNIIVQDTASRNGTTRMINMHTADTTAGIIVMRNNIFEVTNGANVARPDRFNTGQMVNSNNIYKLSGGGVLNFPTNSTEIETNGVIWVDTTNANPLFWDYNLTATSPGINNGVDVGLTRDFNNNLVGTIPDIGVLEFIATQPTNKIFTNLKFKSIP